MPIAFDPLTAVLNLGGQLIDRIFPDKAAADAAKLEMLKMQQSGELAQMAGQMDINKVEAASSSVFVAGWRPAVGWTCAAAFAFKFVLGPSAVVLMAIIGHPITLPVFDFSEMSTILLGMLGLGGLRTVEKIKGVS